MSLVFKALMKKQLTEILLSFTGAGRNRNKNSGKRSLIGYILLLLLVFASFGFMFGMAADSIYVTLQGTEIEWLYFSLMGIMALFMSVLGSAFTTYAAIYKANDNETLLSMPIPQHLILLVRMFGCYITAFIFCAAVEIPALIVRCSAGGVSPVSVINILLSLLILPLISLAISCLLGWVIALIAPHVKHKSIVTAAVSIVFITGYYIFYMRASSILQSIVAYADQAEAAIKSWLFPFYMMGRGQNGEIIPFAVFTVIAAAIFAVVYAVMSRSFIGLATASEKSVKTVYREKKARSSSQRGALLRRELIHFAGSAAYIMNCSLGSIFMVILSVLAIIQSGRLWSLLAEISSETPGFSGIVPLIIGAALAILISYNLLTVPSVSLEGRSFWLVRSLPVSTKSVLRAKMDLHLLLTLPVSLICGAIVFIVTRSDPLCSAAVLIFLAAYNVASASLGLVIALKMPNLNYSDEATAIKHNWGVTIIMFGGMIVIGGLALLYFFIHSFMAPWMFALAAAAVFAVISALILKWIYTKGVMIFESL